MTESLVDAVMRANPEIDRMMAETICKMHEQGRLHEFVAMMKTESNSPSETKIVGIAVEDGSKKSSPTE